MSLKKIYGLAETRAAIDRADNRNINSLKMVRSDVSVTDWGKTNIKVKDRNPNSPVPFPGQKDVGHVFRHVNGTGTAGKSIYFDRQTAVAVTCELLNSTQGQTALGVLDAEVRDLYDNSPTSVTVDVTGVFYGSNDNGASWQRITKAKCQLQKLGDLLWVHTSYPTELAGTGINFLAASANMRRIRMGHDF
jgi:hypothetical protein